MGTLGNNLFAEYYAQQHTLPKEYRQVAYLQATGTQRIDTVFRATENTKVYCGFKINKNEQSPWIFGSRNGGSEAQDRFALFVYRTDDRIIPTIGISSDIVYKSLGQQKHTLAMSLYGGVIIDNELVHEYTPEQKAWRFTSVYPLSLFTMREGENQYNNHLEGNIYCFFALENSMYVCKFVPCIRKSDNKPGLYDLCGSICPLTGNSFYINAGTGEFVTP